MPEPINPFSAFGQIVSPDKFIGREKEIRTLKARVLQPNQGACAAIVSEARIGKTSLAQYVFSRDSEDVKKIKGLVVELSIGIMTPQTLFFSELVKKIQRELKRQSKEDAEMVKLLAENIHEDRPDEFLEYFEEVGILGYRPIIILDEFDDSIRVLGDRIEKFQLLRQLGYDPRYRTSLVTTSRITIGNIETQSAISTLGGIFLDIHLGLFSQKEVDTFLATRLGDNPIQFTAQEKESLLKFSGYHPFIMEVCAFHLYNQKLENGTENLSESHIELVFDSVQGELNKTFDNYKERMGEECFKTLLLTTIGFPMPIVPLHLSRLIQQGHVTEVKNGKNTHYRPFGTAYEGYLHYWSRHIDLWPLWTTTERRLRQLIDQQYTKLA
jgi:AAA+ ATPase superfamily predicted ATPase